MNEVTPDLIAQIATRLYNEIPGASRIPKTEAEASQAASDAAGGPAGLADVPAAVSFLPIAPETAGGNLIGPLAPEPATDGLSAFVQKIRSPFRSNDGRCRDGLDHDLHRRLFAGKAPPVERSRPFDVPAIRKDFPILHQQVHGKPLVWLDNAATTQKPQSVIDALSQFYAHDNSNIHRGAHTLAARSTDAFEQARQKVQAFLGASSSKEIVFVRGSTEGINLVAQTYGRKFLQPGDEIVLSTLEHHANIVPWQMVAKEKGAVLRVIPVTDRGEIMLEEYQALLGPRTKLVALAHASNSLGSILPVA
jgi:cysteine desulfurase/selenocysteine lyase